MMSESAVALAVEPRKPDQPAASTAVRPLPGVRRVLVAATSRLHLQLFVSHLDRSPDRRCAASTDDLDHLVATCRLAEVDLVVLVALGLPAGRVSALVREVVTATGLGVVVVARGGDPEQLSGALQAGARGYVTEASGLIASSFPNVFYYLLLFARIILTAPSTHTSPSTHTKRKQQQHRSRLWE